MLARPTARARSDVNVAIVLYVNQAPIDNANFRKGIEGARQLVR